ncbi:transcriptional regulator with XRE-family HTH domain [Leifsonia sp. EB41]|uniref:helix-turn-helix domain-containing protein n=1 Tax=Leifsonia sp. EB41 TaxID=3156260 RepID=UPI003515BE7A
MTTDDDFGYNFARARSGAGLSREYVADALDRLGYSMHPSAIGKIERNERRVTVGEAQALATIVNKSVEELLGGAWRTEVLLRAQQVEDAYGTFLRVRDELEGATGSLAEVADRLRDELELDPDLHLVVLDHLRLDPWARHENDERSVDFWMQMPNDRRTYRQFREEHKTDG